MPIPNVYNGKSVQPSDQMMKVYAWDFWLFCAYVHGERQLQNPFAKFHGSFIGCSWGKS